MAPGLCGCWPRFWPGAMRLPAPGAPGPRKLRISPWPRLAKSVRASRPGAARTGRGRRPFRLTGGGPSWKLNESNLFPELGTSGFGWRRRSSRLGRSVLASGSIVDADSGVGSGAAVGAMRGTFSTGGGGTSVTGAGGGSKTAVVVAVPISGSVSASTPRGRGGRRSSDNHNRFRMLPEQGRERRLAGCEVPGGRGNAVLRGYSAVILSSELDATRAAAMPSDLAVVRTSLFSKPSFFEMS